MILVQNAFRGGKSYCSSFTQGELLNLFIFNLFLRCLMWALPNCVAGLAESNGGWNLGALNQNSTFTNLILMLALINEGAENRRGGGDDIV